MSTPKQIYISGNGVKFGGTFYSDYPNDVQHIKYIRADVVDELKRSLNDLLNDCINFDGGKLTDCIMKQASDTLKALKLVDGGFE